MQQKWSQTELETFRIISSIENLFSDMLLPVFVGFDQQYKDGNS